MACGCGNNHNHNHHHGNGALSHWIKLRVSAILLVPFTIWIVYSLIALKDTDFAGFTAWFQNPLNAAGAIAFIIFSFYHGALGVQEILEDYVPDEKIRHCASAAQKLALLVLALISILSILKIAF